MARYSSVCLGDPGHFLALVDAVGHELFGQHVQAGLHGGDGRFGVQVQRQGDDHAFQAVVLGVFDQFLIGVVDLDVPRASSSVFQPYLAISPGRSFKAFVAVMIAVKRPPDVVRADVGDRFHFDEFGIDRADEHAAFVAGADHAHANRRADGFIVAEIKRTQAAADHHAGGKRALEKIAAAEIAGGRIWACGDAGVLGASLGVIFFNSV